MEEIEAMKAIAEKLEKLSDEERGRVLSWASSKYGAGLPLPSAIPSASATKETAAPPVQRPNSGKSAPKAKSSKKSKSIISMDKSLNLAPSGKKSAVDFATEKAPSNAMHKCVVAVYYLRETIAMSAITVSAVYTFFKTLGWPVPSDIKNVLQQAGTKGWLDTKDGDDIKLTSMGENLVEHSLPPKSKA